MAAATGQVAGALGGDVSFCTICWCCAVQTLGAQHAFSCMLQCTDLHDALVCRNGQSLTPALQVTCHAPLRHHAFVRGFCCADICSLEGTSSDCQCTVQPTVPGFVIDNTFVPACHGTRGFSTPATPSTAETQADSKGSSIASSATSKQSTSPPSEQQIVDWSRTRDGGAYLALLKAGAPPSAFARLRGPPGAVAPVDAARIAIQMRQPQGKKAKRKLRWLNGTWLQARHLLPPREQQPRPRGQPSAAASYSSAETDAGDAQDMIMSQGGAAADVARFVHDRKAAKDDVLVLPNGMTLRSPASSKSAASMARSQQVRSTPVISDGHFPNAMQYILCGLGLDARSPAHMIHSLLLRASHVLQRTSRAAAHCDRSRYLLCRWRASANRTIGGGGGGAGSSRGAGSRRRTCRSAWGATQTPLASSAAAV